MLKSTFTIITWLLLVITNVGALNYLVILKASESIENFMKYDVTFPVAQRVKKFITKDYKIGNLVGFSGNFTKAAVERLKRCPMIAEITPDVIFNALEIVEQPDAPAHLVRLSQEASKKMTKRSYFYDGDARGSDVNVYIIDSGLQVNHPEFESRAQHGIDLTQDGEGDTNGHGTHVAGIIGSKTYGVAKDATLIEVKTLDKTGQGSLGKILEALQFATSHRKVTMRPGVANLSLGATKNSVLNFAINSASETGLVIVVAAGNQNVDACSSLPASAELAITVGSTDDSTNGMAEFSNHGPCVDVFASGVSIASVDINDKNVPTMQSGTSMSAPIIAGLCANFLSEGMSPFEVKQHLLDLAVNGRIVPRSIKGEGTPNLLAYNGCDPEAEKENLDSDTDSDSEDS